MTTNHEDDAVLERNVETLLETGGEAPRIHDVARARIRASLLERHGKISTARPLRTPLVAVGLGVVAAAAAALIVARDTGGGGARDGRGVVGTQGSSWITAPGGKVTALSPRRARVEGAALLDIEPGHGPFVVETAHGTIEVLGTRFLVDASSSRTTTAVVRGQVKLASAQGSVVVHAGEQAIAEPGRPPTRGPAPRLSHLVSWAAEARRAQETASAPRRTGSLFARSPGVRAGGQFADGKPLPLERLGVDVVVENQVARVALDQTFYNPHSEVLEGVYKFTIPPEAALQRLAMYVDGKLTESAVVERMRARAIYEELVYRRVDPALLEWAGTGRVDLRVYPLPAQQEKRILLAYTESLPRLYSDWTLRVPMPEIDQPVGELALDVRVRDCATCEVTSTSHAITVRRDDQDAVVTYRQSSATIGDSLVLHVRDPRQETRVVRHDVDGASFTLVRSPLELPRIDRPHRPKTWVVLDDVSASRGPIERRAQADLIDAFVKELDEQDRLAVIAFDVEARTKLGLTRVIDVESRQLRDALAYEGDVGATDLASALEAALPLLAGVAPEDAMILYLGDGVVTSGPRGLDAIRAKITGKATFVGVGVGDGPDVHVLQALAAATGGYATTIDLADDLRWRAFDLVAALHTGRITGLEARLVDATGGAVPATVYTRTGQLADGDEIEVVAKLAGGGTPARLELAGALDGAPWTRSVALGGATSPTGDHAYLPRLWAQRHVAARLLAKHEPVIVAPCPTVVRGVRGVAPPPCRTEAETREARDEAIRKEVVELGKKYFLLSRHTSLIVLENDAMYTQYGVEKGSGRTWAPYKTPATIPVVTRAPTTRSVGVSDDALLVRSRYALFHGDPSENLELDERLVMPNQSLRGTDSWGTIGTGRFGTIGHGSGTGTGYGVGRGFGAVEGFGPGGGGTGWGVGAGRGGMRGRSASVPTVILGQPTVAPAGAVPATATAGDDPQLARQQAIDQARMAGILGTRNGEPPSVTTGELKRRAKWGTKGPSRRLHHGWWTLPIAQLARMHYPGDALFDDVTAFVPAMFPDAFDDWRADLATSLADRPHAIDARASKLLEAARRALPAGVYRWGELEVAVDAQQRFAWRRTHDTDLMEVATFDGTTFSRRYTEIGLDVTRSIGDDDVALGLAYLPIWIADPAHYARYFVVRATGDREVSLALPGATPEVVLVLSFDDRHRVVGIRDGQGRSLVDVRWDDRGPISATLGTQVLRVGFSALSVADAVAWAQAASVSVVGSTPPIVVELPLRMPAYWQSRIAAETVGSTRWRHLQHQRMASLAALEEVSPLFAAYEEIRKSGPVVLGELALASSGVARGANDTQLAAAVAPLGTTLLARYITASRQALRTAGLGSWAPDAWRPASTAGYVGALWQLRASVAAMVSGSSDKAVDGIVALGDRALLFRRILAAGTLHRAMPTEAAHRLFASVRVGRYANQAMASLAQAYFNAGNPDLGANAIEALVTQYDLDAAPVEIGYLLQQVHGSRRGYAGAQMMWVQLREKLLASDRFEHVLSLLGTWGIQADETLRILTRARALADDPDRQLAVLGEAMNRGQIALARDIVGPMITAAPSPAVYAIAASLERAQGNPARALEHLEAAHDLDRDEATSLSTVRAEMTQILALAQEVALASSGPARDAVLAKANAWGKRWRAVDPDNPQIDQTMGALMLAVGDTRQAWRQLSTVIEQAPMSGTGYQTVAEVFERQGRIADAIDLWQQAIVIEQTNPTPRLRKAQALIAVGRAEEGDALLAEIVSRDWHAMHAGTKETARSLLARGTKLRR